MTGLAAKICHASCRDQDATSEEIAARVGARPEYVRTVWQRNNIKRLRKHGERKNSGSVGALRAALEQLFLAITEEGRDVEAAIQHAERVLYGTETA